MATWCSGRDRSPMQVEHYHGVTVNIAGRTAEDLRHGLEMLEPLGVPASADLSVSVIGMNNDRLSIHASWVEKPDAG